MYNNGDVKNLSWPKERLAGLLHVGTTGDVIRMKLCPNTFYQCTYNRYYPSVSS